MGLNLYSAIFFLFVCLVVFWVLIVGFAAVFAALSFFIFAHVLIISTSLIGSYAFVRGISLYAGHYPNEFTLASLI